MTPLTRLACVALLAATALPAVAAPDPSELPDGTDIAGATDHPKIQRFDGSSIRFMEKVAFDELVLAVGPRENVPEDKTKIVEGMRTTLVYVVPKDVSPLEAMRGYQDELAKLGEVTVLFQGVNTESRRELGGSDNTFVNATYGDDGAGQSWMQWNKEGRYAALQIAGPDGDIFVALYAGHNQDTSGANFFVIPADRVAVRLDIIEPKPRAQRMVTVSAGDMADAIAANGRVSLYGILFDTGKADVKPDSLPALQQIGELMKSEPKLRLLVVGHTDTVGAFEGNRDLSQRRAKAVVAALTTQQGVDAPRLQAFGASFAAPVASNGDEAGRAKNRRVELVAY